MSKTKYTQFGKYILIKKIGQGGMAEIFLASTGDIQEAQKFLVIKRILLNQSANPSFNKMFKSEGKIAVNLNHAQICSIYEFGSINNQYFICMEHIKGKSLQQFIKKLKIKKQAVDIAIFCHIIKCVCDGLEYAHNAVDNTTGQPLNVIHRDISPQNIMLSYNGDIKVIDFGIAKIDNSDATKVGVLKGKFEYMSPEQVRGLSLDRQSDIFSLGNVFWEVLARRKLFKGENEIQLLQKIRRCQIPDIKKINPKVPSRLVEIINKALSPNKNIRYKSMQEFSNDITIFMNKTYPSFTSHIFSSYIKNIYVEEILEERQNLKSYSQFIRNKIKPSLSKRSSEDIKEQNKKATFIGSKNLKSIVTGSSTSKDSISLQPNIGLAQKEDITQTETKHKTPITQTVKTVSQITHTKFNDTLEDITGEATIDSNTLKNKISSTAITNIGDNDNPKWQTSISYEPWKINSDLNLKHQQESIDRDRAKNIYKKKIKAVYGIVFILSLVLGGVYFFTDLKSTPTIHKWINNITSRTESVTTKKPLASPSSLQKNKATIEATAGSSRQVNNVKRQIFISSSPVGARLFIDDRYIDTTPTTITIESRQRPFTLTFKKVRYQAQKKSIDPSSFMNNRINVILVKKKIKKTNSAPQITILK